MKGFKRGLTRGFTLVELIIVIVIIGILAAVAVPQFTGVQNNAELANFRATVASMQASVTGLYAANTEGAATAYATCADVSTKLVADGLDLTPASDITISLGTLSGNKCPVTVTGITGAPSLSLTLPWK